MVPLDRALVSSYRLSIVTMSLTAAVGRNLQCNAMQLLYKTCLHNFRKLCK